MSIPNISNEQKMAVKSEESQVGDDQTWMNPLEQNPGELQNLPSVSPLQSAFLFQDPPLFFFFRHYLFPCSYLLWQATTCPTVPRISSMALQSLAWPLPSWLAAHPISRSCFHAEKGPPTCLGCCQLLVMRGPPSNVI